MVVKISTHCFNGGWNPRKSRQFIATFSRHVGKTPKGSGLGSGNPIPKLAETFRLRIYYKLPRPIFWGIKQCKDMVMLRECALFGLVI